MNGRSYDTPPKNLGSLEQRLRNIVADGDLQLRTRRQIGYMAVIAALTAHARDGEGKPLFAIAISPAKVTRLEAVLKDISCLFTNAREATTLSGLSEAGVEDVVDVVPRLARMVDSAAEIAAG